jgi:ATP adenylyltransferase
MDRLWSPWRYTYVSKSGQSTGCIFCDKSKSSATEQEDADNFVIYRAEFNFVLLNIFPYTGGHLMIAPYAHVPSLTAATGETVAEMMRLTREAEGHLRDIYFAPGFNIGMNIGEAAGAGVAGHIHMHVLPRWPGDANFMTTVGETRVLPEDLRTSYEKLRAAFAA